MVGNLTQGIYGYFQTRSGMYLWCVVAYSLNRWCYPEPLTRQARQSMTMKMRLIKADGQSASLFWCRTLFVIHDQILSLSSLDLKISWIWIAAPSLTRGQVYSLHCSQSLVQVLKDISANFTVRLETGPFIPTGTAFPFTGGRSTVRGTLSRLHIEQTIYGWKVYILGPILISKLPHACYKSCSIRHLYSNILTLITEWCKMWNN
jgi:hypothetical protein